MNVDLEMMLAARNYAIKLQEEYKKHRQAYQRRIETLEETLEEVEIERNLVKEELKEHKRYFEQAMKLAIENGNKVFDKREGHGQ